DIIDHDLGIAAVVPALVALRHYLHFGIGEVGLGLVVGHVAEGRGRPAAGVALALPDLLGRLGATLPFGFGLGLGLFFQTPLSLLDFGQPLLTETQFLGQFVAATGSQG